MDLKFYFPIKEKSLSPVPNRKTHMKDRAEISIPAKFLENILTNRQKQINNKSFDKARKSKMTNNYFLSESTSNLKSNKMFSKFQISNKKLIKQKKNSYLSKEILINENKKLKEENFKLKKIIENLRNNQENTIQNNNLQKEQLANLILSLSYEKQNEDLNGSINFSFNENKHINLIDDNYGKNKSIKGNIDGKNKNLNSEQKKLKKMDQQSLFTQIMNRTKNILTKYDKALKTYSNILNYQITK